MKMKNFYKCEFCGSVVSMLNDSGVKLNCCGHPMTVMAPNSVDAAAEKHVPVATRDGNKLTVNVGSAPHPMAAEHRIEWIMAAQDKRTQRVVLDAGADPAAEFILDDGPVTVYGYCNIHGLWQA